MSVEEELKMKAISFIAGTSTMLSVTCTAQELFIADGGRALVFNPVTLQENREFVTQNGTHPSSFQNDVAMEYWNGALYIVNDGGLFAYDPMTGDLINQAVQTPSVDRGYALKIIDGDLYIADGSRVLVFDTETLQEIRWFTVQNGTHPSSRQNDVAMEYWNGALYIVNDGGLFAYDPMTGDLINQAVQTPSVDRGYALLMISQCNSIADINGDGELSGADFSAWVIAFNTNSSQCDQNHDGLCTPADFSAWVSNYNMGCS